MSEKGPPKNGRARGRAKGRARPAQAQGRPGEEQRVVQGAAAAAAPGPPGQPGPSAGRQTHRGVPRADPRPGERQAGGDIAERMEALRIEPHTVGREAAPPPVGRGGRGFRHIEEEVRTRPAHLKTKQATGAAAGAEIKLVTNYFDLESRPQWCVYQYHVDFAPVVESSRMRHALLHDHNDVLGECYLFDGMSDLKMVVRLERETTELYSQRRTDNETIHIKIRRTNELAPNNPQLQQLFNTQMRRNLRHLEFQLIGRNYFDRQAVTENNRHQLQIWPGIVTSIRMQEYRLMMSVDTIHKIVRRETVWDKLSELAKSFRRDDDFRAAATRELMGAIVMTRYNNRTYRIEEICWDEKPTDTFESKAGKISFMDYYKSQYDHRIRDQHQPLLLCTSKEREVRGGERTAKRILLVPETCLLTGLTDQMRANFTIMRDIANVTRLDPQQRVNNLENFIRKINQHPKVTAEMRSWDLRFSGELLKLNGHVLPKEEIVQRQLRCSYDPKTAEFSREIRSKPMHVAVKLSRWVLICTEKDKAICQEFVATLKSVSTPLGMDIGEPYVIAVANDRTSSFQNAYLDYLKEKPPAQMAVFVVPNNKKDRYDALKKLTCCDRPVPNQVVVTRTLVKRQTLMSVATKIGIQMNCKLGGEPWCVDIPFTNPVMIVGYDTYHNSAQRGGSAGGFVASMNKQFTRWYSQVNFHAAGCCQELSDHMYSNLTVALRKFHEYNKRTPEMIIFYRDGVGDGQVNTVLEWEVKSYLKCLKDVLKAEFFDPETKTPGIKCTFIIVNKRISTRFFHLHQGHHSNPPPGTAVDDHVTRYHRYDFFLVSQSVRQGTVAPTMYNIIHDCSGLQPAYMQRLSYKLTHLYFNWPGTVRVPAPCQYAHKLAFLAGQSLHRQPHISLADTLFYL